jgi:nucleoside-diphosphate-sugar epimerase
MRGVLVTHADEPLGRRIVKTLYHDEEIDRILAVGTGPAPRAFDRFLAGSPARVSYARADLAKHRTVSDLFRSARFRELALDTVVHVPAHGPSAASEAPIVSGVPSRTVEARLVLQHSLEARSVESLIAIGSAFVYRLQPGNANHLMEASELDLDPGVPAEIRSWIDCDMIFHAETGSDRLRVVLLRVPTVVASGGFVYLNPVLGSRLAWHLRPLGYDPMCAVVADKDVARAVRSAVLSERSGVYNVAGRETIPLSVLARWTRRTLVPAPSPMLRSAAWLARTLRQPVLRAAVDGPHLRFGMSLDTRRAERELAFRPSYRVGLCRAGDGRLQIETSGV